MWHLAAVAVQVIVSGVVIASVAAAGGALAVRVRCDRVVGEIAAGLIASQAFTQLAGPGAVDRLLPAPALSGLTSIAQAALALFLIGVMHGLGSGAARGERGVARFDSRRPLRWLDQREPRPFPITEVGAAVLVRARFVPARSGDCHR